MKFLIPFIIISTICLNIYDCRQKVNPSNEDKKKEINIDTEVQFIINNFFIGEIFESGVLYLEPLNMERSDLEYKRKNLPEPEKSINYYIAGNSNAKIEIAKYLEKYAGYIPEIESTSIYYSAPFSKPIQTTFKYKGNFKPEKPYLVISLLNHKNQLIDYSESGKKRLFSSEEYTAAVERIKNDHARDDNRTLKFIEENDTILNAKYLCSIIIFDSNYSLKLSKYFTHGTEYAGDVYVLDIIKDNQVIKTVERFNYDGPY